MKAGDRLVWSYKPKKVVKRSLPVMDKDASLQRKKQKVIDAKT